MMWFTADLHLGDTNILHDMDRPFDSVEEMNRKVIDAINECVAADDRLYILGDFTYRLPLAEAVRLRERIECQNVTLIRGNHDGDWEDSDVPNRDRERPIFRYDVGLDANDYKPVSRDQILSFFRL